MTGESQGRLIKDGVKPTCSEQTLVDGLDPPSFAQNSER